MFTRLKDAGEAEDGHTSRRPAAALARGLAVALLGCWVAGCAPADDGALSAAASPDLYVANGAEGTITRVESVSGQVIGPPLPASPGPWRMVSGPGGSLLVQAIGSAVGRQDSPLTYLARSGGEWVTRPVALEARAEAPLIAGDGGRYAVAAYHVRSGGAVSEAVCRLALIDLRVGAVTGTHTVCTGEESVAGLAMENGPAGLVAYLGIWHRPVAEGEPEGARDAGGATGATELGSRVLAVDAETGDGIGVYPLAGTPGSVILAPGPGRTGRRLYSVEALPDPDTGTPEDSYEGQYTRASEWRLLGLNPATLEPESEHTLSASPFSLAVAPDGDHAYFLLDGDRVRHLDLATGTVTGLAALPGFGTDLAVTATRVYVPDSRGDSVWAVDRRSGRLATSIAVGRHPIGILASGA
ncbi:MAG: YncE family protein [Chloroflexota bacterium]